ncbi:MAG: HD domain-containing protein [Bacillus sp. (in: firmicutes)]
MKLLNEPLYPPVSPFDWEMELFQSRYVRRLKHLAHFGAGSFVSSVTHSRFEHTIGVWKLAAYFFPKDNSLRAAAILHDIGHLPFSHSVERILGFNHHSLTNQYIQSEQINHILYQAGMNADEICTILNRDSSLTGSKEILGFDHLDSFFRDNYMAGTLDKSPIEYLQKITCTEQGIETDSVTAQHLMKLIILDNTFIHSPLLLAADRLLAEAVKLHWKEEKEGFSSLIDAEVITKLKHSPIEKVKNIIDVLLFHPSKIYITETHTKKGLEINKGKVYNKQPLVNGRPFAETTIGKTCNLQLASLLKEYTVTII